MDIQERARLFKNPDSSYRGKPFWAWNGELLEEELLRQIEVMQEMGFGGYFMHSRTGLETEYLGKKWFADINRCADYGSDRNLEAWLYDEDRWPSGTAGGIVTKDQRYQAMRLEMKQLTKAEYTDYRWDEHSAAVFACQLDGHFYDKERKLGKGEKLREGEKVIVFETCYSECKDVYNGYTYLDTMNKEGVEKYIEVTHAAYGEHCGGRLGKEIKGIFTDEPHRGAMFSDFAEGREYGVPYTPQLFEAFRTRFGYRLEDHLLGLFLRKKGNPLSKVSWDYIELCQELFLENFAMPIQKWCHDNHIIFTGHVLHEDSLSAQSVMQGSVMRFYEYMDYPGIDVLTESNECYWIVKQVESVARQLQKEKVLSELYGGCGWQMNFEAYKNVGDWQALLGVNLRCPHLSWYTMKGEAKRDYPASILHQSGWFSEYAWLEDYYSRIHLMLSEGAAVCELLVLNPVESVWARASSQAFSGLEARDKEIQNLEQTYQALFWILMENRIDFDYGDEDIMSRHGYVEGGILHIGKCSYKKVLITGMDTIRSHTIGLLRKFLKQGGKVIFAGKIPSYVDVQPSKDAEELAAAAVRIPFNGEDIVEACLSGKEIQVEGTGDKDILASVKESESGRTIMLLNKNRKQGHEKIKVRFAAADTADYRIECWDLRSGQIHAEEARKEKGALSVTMDFAKGEEKLFVITEEERRPSVRSRLHWGERLILPQKFKYHLDEDNIIVLDQVVVRNLLGEVIAGGEVLRADRMLRDVYGLPYRSGEMRQPWYEKKYGQDYRKTICNVGLEFSFEVGEIPRKIRLALEDLTHINRITMNGSIVLGKSEGKWIDICFDIIHLNADCLVKGVNTLCLQYDYCRAGGLEAVYLLGNFGVWKKAQGEGMVLANLPKELELGDITTQGFPFYSGKITYLLEDTRTGFTAVDDLMYAGAYAKLCGKQKIMIACAPYSGCVQGLKGIEIGLTRRNTFGPLHRLPEKAVAYGPETFMTEGEEWQDAPVLCKQGLLGARLYSGKEENGQYE